MQHKQMSFHFVSKECTHTHTHTHTCNRKCLRPMFLLQCHLFNAALCQCISKQRIFYLGIVCVCVCVSFVAFYFQLRSCLIQFCSKSSAPWLFRSLTHTHIHAQMHAHYIWIWPMLRFVIISLHTDTRAKKGVQKPSRKNYSNEAKQDERKQ